MSWVEDFKADLKEYTRKYEDWEELPEGAEIVSVSTEEREMKCAEGTCDYEIQGIVIHYKMPEDRWTFRELHTTLEFRSFLKWATKRRENE